ncbi:MAG: quinoprotein dehydrogenase-associated putative ABC transporter substrate-binding protein [Rhodobacteraceae bacterium]|jgi:quinoprotein dehydrogenase-associated probable ABC transporter substrate-binding protein|uniref:substrate-binding domain-containing protein n=1 Tax=Albidovulum sp. TaxID=1872424 RepID=UPI001DFF9A43|nr:substrate-binding domain-containing protein [uncultured Defluviimonas sp.]MCB2125990.1 substrate-binding domain-containing protein [Paracoccaceae bacterium]MCC0070427.1 quinoprotein dehydrogenase-associated putative ABC transporter substrate-binding protein [Paracoccaceae bacterium]
MLRRLALLATVAALFLAAPLAAQQTSDLVSDTAFRVCADPANRPMSAEDGSGFENRIAELLAADLGLPLEYTWYPMATGFIRRTLAENRCDVVIGYAQGDELVLNTNHYYTSAYVLIVKADGPLAGVTALSDPALKGKRVGVVAGSAPATHLVRNGLMALAKGYDLFADRRYQDPSGDMLADLEAGEIDAAILWGPIGGPLVKQSHPGLKVTPLLSEPGQPRMFYRITMGVRQGEKSWSRKLNSLIRRDQAKIDAILAEAGVPILDDMGTAAKAVSP